jgi:superfamily I DNA and/or RNA helicase
MFKKETNLLAVDLKNTKQSWKQKDKSASNHAHVFVMVALVELLLNHAQERFAPQDILILVPYRAQASLYEDALQNQHPKAPRLGLLGVKVDTIDRFQGGECPIVVLDS